MWPNVLESYEVKFTSCQLVETKLRELCIARQKKLFFTQPRGRFQDLYHFITLSRNLA